MGANDAPRENALAAIREAAAELNANLSADPT
jgi:hypothetical protein